VLGYSLAIRECHLSLQNKSADVALKTMGFTPGAVFCRSARRFAMTAFVASCLDSRT
jgi:hypothetical protein